MMTDPVRRTASDPPAGPLAADQERALLAAIIESSQNAILTVSPDGLVLSWNKGAERLFGYAPSEAIGQPIKIIVSNDSLAERALRESEQRFVRFMNALPGLAWIKDLEGRYVFTNDAAQKPFGFPREQLYGKTDDELFPQHTAEQFKANDQRALQTKDGVQVIESLMHEDGVHHSLVSKFPIPGTDGATAYIGGMAIDISDRIRAEEALRESDLRKDEFLATLAHELRNPLAPIRNSLNILKITGDSSPAAQSLHETIDRQIAHMVRLVDDLLDLSRINCGKIELRREVLDFATVTQNAVETSRPLIDAAGHQLTVTLPPERLLVEGDLVRLSQVFANLLNNAAKYTNPGGRIALTATREANEVVVSVQDNGVGVPTEMLTRVFDMFAQVNAARGQMHGGLGIGLNLVKTLVSLHGGTVLAKSAGLGQGSEFLVRLPIAEPSRATETGAAPSSPAHTSVKQRILVVDDNRDSADTLGMLLKLLGAETHVVYDGPSALEAVHTFRPAIVLLDLGMPGMTGYDVARELRCSPAARDLQLVALTGWGQDEDRRRTQEAGFNHHLVKPVDLTALESVLAEMKG